MCSLGDGGLCVIPRRDEELSLGVLCRGGGWQKSLFLFDKQSLRILCSAELVIPEKKGLPGLLGLAQRRRDGV